MHRGDGGVRLQRTRWHLNRRSEDVSLSACINWVTHVVRLAVESLLVKLEVGAMVTVVRGGWVVSATGMQLRGGIACRLRCAMIALLSLTSYFERCGASSETLASNPPPFDKGHVAVSGFYTPVTTDIPSPTVETAPSPSQARSGDGPRASRSLSRARRQRQACC